MDQIPDTLKYVDTHEWLRLETDGSVTIGITHHAQELLGDVVFVELPKVGAVLAYGASAGVVESVKAASDVYAPLAGEVVAVNTDLETAPELANQDPYGAAWFFRIKPANPSDLDNCLNAADYTKLLS